MWTINLVFYIWDNPLTVSSIDEEEGMEVEEIDLTVTDEESDESGNNSDYIYVKYSYRAWCSDTNSSPTDFFHWITRVAVVVAEFFRA